MHGLKPTTLRRISSKANGLIASLTTERDKAEKLGLHIAKTDKDIAIANTKHLLNELRETSSKRS